MIPVETIDLEPIFSEIQSKLSALRNDDIRITIRKREDRPSSTIVFFETSDRQGVQRLMLKKVIKIPRVGPVGEVDAESEYNTLKRLYSKYETVEGCSVPKPVLLLSRFDALVMEAYDAPLVQDQCGALKYFSNREAFNDLKRRIRLAGIWLRHFQNFMGIRLGGSEDLTILVEDSRLRLKKLQMFGSERIPSDLHDRVMRQLEKLILEASGEKIPITIGHGDFGPWNVLATPRGITVIDFSTIGETPICRDPLQMFLFLRDQRQNPFQSRRRIAELEEVFSQGYGPRIEMPAAAVAVCETHERLVKLCGAAFPDKEWKRKFEQNAVTKSHIAWLLDEEGRLCLWS